MAKLLRIEGDERELRELERAPKDPRQREKLQAIRMGTSGAYTMEEIAQAVGEGSFGH